ncbi:MAG: nitroreductase [Oscillospiraceae bacterium]|nr:nitroreductase [Oscillospiraceae bacterium]
MNKTSTISLPHSSDLIRARRSVRSFEKRTPEAAVVEQLLDYGKSIKNPFGIPVEFRVLHAAQHGLLCPVTNGTELYAGSKIAVQPFANAAFGYSFEVFLLYAQSLGLGSVWLGGTMNRSAFEQAMELRENEMMPCAAPIGYPAKRMTVRETAMRKAIKADERLPFEALFFDSGFTKPLTPEKAGVLRLPLEAVRLAPSAVNKQPWRVVLADGCAYFYLLRSKGFARSGVLDMQMIDMGIALCHFALCAAECGLALEFVQLDPAPDSEEVEYVGSYRIS